MISTHCHVPYRSRYGVFRALAILALLLLVRCKQQPINSNEDNSDNTPPFFLNVARTCAMPGEQYTTTLRAKDADGDALAFSLLTSSAGMSAADSVITWNPTTAHEGTHAVSAQVHDGRGGYDTLAWTITVSAAPPPVFKIELQAFDAITGASIPSCDIKFWYESLGAPGDSIKQVEVNYSDGSDNEIITERQLQGFPANRTYHVPEHEYDVDEELWSVVTEWYPTVTATTFAGAIAETTAAFTIHWTAEP